jgi:hypothetical protein
MAISNQLTRYAGRKLTRRLTRSIPWIGGVIALVGLGGAIRRKGFLGGTMHTALDAIPYVGGAKNLVEFGRGRDFFPDRQIPRAGERRITQSSPPSSSLHSAGYGL